MSPWAIPIGVGLTMNALAAMYGRPLLCHRARKHAIMAGALYLGFGVHVFAPTFKR